MESIGLRIEIGRGDLEMLRSTVEMGLPVIVALDTAYLSYWAEKTDHAVVVAGVDADIVIVHDPDLPDGPQLVPAVQFESAWLEHDYRYAVISS